MAYDPSWSERMRKRLLIELAPVIVHCPWLGEELGDPLKMGPADLLVAEALLPEARKAAEQQVTSDQQKRAATEEESTQLREEHRAILNGLRVNLASYWHTADACEAIESDIGLHAELLARLRARGETSPAWAGLLKQVTRTEPALHQVREQLGALERLRAINILFLNWGVGLAFLVLLWLLPAYFSLWIRYAIIGVGVGVVAWRLVPTWLVIQRLRELGSELPSG
jgi:hypothetical protein